MTARLKSACLATALLAVLTSGCSLMSAASSGEQRCADNRTAANKQIQQSSALMRSVQFAASSEDANQKAADGIAALRTGLTTMRDHGNCFDEEQRAWATQQLDSWDGDKIFRNVIGCFYSRQQTGSVPNFCNFSE